MNKLLGLYMLVVIALGGSVTWPAGLGKSSDVTTSVAIDPAVADPARGSAEQFFGLSKLYTFELTIAPSDFQRMAPESGGGGRGFGGGADQEGSGYPKVHARLGFDGHSFGEVTIRYKGNSSYRGAPSLLKRSLKIHFNEPNKRHRFFGLSVLNLNNNAFDSSQMRESLSYAVFREAGVPAPRTAFAVLYVTVPGRYQHEYAGLFTLVEQVDQRFFKDRWDDKVGVLVKPEGLSGTPDLGNKWQAYADAYASKLDATPAGAQRLIDFVQFVDHASDSDFVSHLQHYLDVEEFLRFLAVEVAIVNTDSPLAMNHNYWLTVQPGTHRVVWIPWDMNESFGGFASGDSDLSVHRPSAPGNFPLADRVLASPLLRARYDAILRELVLRTTSPAMLTEQMRRIADVIRPAVARDATITPGEFERNLQPRHASDGASPGDREVEFGWGAPGRRSHRSS